MTSHQGVISQVFAHVAEIDKWCYSHRAQLVGIAYTTELQDLRRADGPSRKDDLLTRLEDDAVAYTPFKRAERVRTCVYSLDAFFATSTEVNVVPLTSVSDATSLVTWVCMRTSRFGLSRTGRRYETAELALRPADVIEFCAYPTSAYHMVSTSRERRRSTYRDPADIQSSCPDCTGRAEAAPGLPAIHGRLWEW